MNRLGDGVTDPVVATPVATAVSYTDPKVVAYGVGALAFSLMVLLLLVYLRRSKEIDVGTFFKLSGLTLVLGSALSLYAVGYDQNQIAPMIGLLGTITGYILGRSEGKGDAPVAG